MSMAKVSPQLQNCVCFGRGDLSPLLLGCAALLIAALVHGVVAVLAVSAVLAALALRAWGRKLMAGSELKAA